MESHLINRCAEQEVELKLKVSVLRTDLSDLFAEDRTSHSRHDDNDNLDPKSESRVNGHDHFLLAPGYHHVAVMGSEILLNSKTNPD